MLDDFLPIRHRANERTPLLQNNQNNMAEKNVGVSQETLVSQAGQTVRAKKLPQYIASLAATLGAVATGMMLGWSSPAGEDGIKLQKTYNLTFTPEEFSWIGALAPLGAGVACIPIGILTDVIGFSGGAFCVTAPMYTAEISENDIRGRVGSYFQLLLTIGILLSYLLGTQVNMYELSIISAVVPIIFCVVFVFMPETPTYYLKKGNEEAARASYVRLRGADYNVEPELSMQRDALEETNRNQQLSGVNAVIFYAGAIFEKAGGSLNSDDASIVIGVMQVAAVFVSTMIVDRLDTKQDVSAIGWLPVVSLCIFIILFSLGFGPLPWMMIGELFAPEVKGIAGSSACLLNWLLAFIVTKTYTNLNNALYSYGTFWLFSVISAIGIFFVLFLVPETKGKSLDDIQRELSA
ncbi:hypothetical protein KPH14_004056 [Odynerus spinipes]|uniref:Uncharacterized protein n=1 Tax=Odynerus spinipes TaxID=1348599 RepID=A0AAD9RZC7_9HYME|nr:hypothetical protein KPH14_004056 [Odynerus spinipes]